MKILLFPILEIMGNNNNKSKVKKCLFCNTTNVNKCIELILSQCDVCYKCDKPLEEHFPTHEPKAYINEKRCDFCPNRLTRPRLLRQALAVCQLCYDNYHGELNRDIKSLVARRNPDDKNKTVGYLCIICDVKYNKLTQKEIKYANYEYYRPRYRLLNGYVNVIKHNESTLPHCNFCGQINRYMRKCFVSC